MIIDGANSVDSLANYFPNDFLFASKFKPGQNLRNLLLGLAQEIARAEEKNVTFVEETNLLQTNELLESWESAFGIPDDCFRTIVGLTVEERIEQILFKIRAWGVQTAQDYIDLAAIIGRTITITIPLGIPHEGFIWIITSDFQGNYPPYDTPYSFDIVIDPLECFLRKLKPANTVLLFENI